MHHPSYYQSSYLDRLVPLSYTDCGDMTGRGNHVLCEQYNDGTGSAYAFYELGSQLDDKIDMIYNDGPMYGEGSIDTITANGDGLQDVIITEQGREAYDDDGKAYMPGTIHIVFGTTKIPSRTAGIQPQSELQAGSLQVYPNPTGEGFCTLSFEATVEGSYHLAIRDILGRVVAERNYAVSPGHESLPLWLPVMPNGTYQAELTSGQVTFLTKFIVSR